MDRLLLDTNFLLDVAVVGRPGSDQAAELFDLAARSNVVCLVTVSSLKDFYYIARKDMDEQIRRDWIALFADVFGVVSMGAAAVARALTSDEPDFEDGLVRAVAELEGCDFIISRDDAAFANSNATRADAGAYLEARFKIQNS